ncbi:MAG: DEAD/DEAH box helicase, partial [Bacteroidota bacterium]
MFLEKLDPNLDVILADHGFEQPTPIQVEGMAKIVAGGDAILIGPKASGKTSLIAITLINKLKEAVEDAPRAIVFVQNKDAALALQEQCKLLGKHTDLRFLCAFEGKYWKDQLEAIYIGADVVIGTVGRLQEIYFKNGLNLNLVKMFIVDNGEAVTHISLVQLERMFMSAPKKCQKLVLGTALTDRI